MTNQTETPYQEQAKYNRPGFALGGFGEGYGTGFDEYGPMGRQMGIPSTIGRYSDQELEHIINSVLDFDPITADADIQVSVKDGVATLTGTTRSAQTKLAAGRDAWSVPSVQDVHNNVQVKPRKHQQGQPAPAPTAAAGLPTQTGPVNDANLADMIYDAIDGDPKVPDQSHIDVHVNDGRVTLIGTVPNKRAKQAAGQDVWNIDAVQDVDNQLHIMGRAERAQGQAQQGLQVEKRPARKSSQSS